MTAKFRATFVVAAIICSAPAIAQTTPQGNATSTPAGPAVGAGSQGAMKSGSMEKSGSMTKSDSMSTGAAASGTGSASGTATGGPAGGNPTKN